MRPVVGLVFLVLDRHRIMSGLVEDAGVLELDLGGRRFGICYGPRTGHCQLRVNGRGVRLGLAHMCIQESRAGGSRSGGLRRALFRVSVRCQIGWPEGVPSSRSSSSWRVPFLDARFSNRVMSLFSTSRPRRMNWVCLGGLAASRSRLILTMARYSDALMYLVSRFHFLSCVLYCFSLVGALAVEK